jgi:hypothetical protein
MRDLSLNREWTEQDRPVPARGEKGQQEEDRKAGRES